MMQQKHYTAVELLQQLLEGNTSSRLIVSRVALEAIIKQLEKEQNLIYEVDSNGPNTATNSARKKAL